MIEEQAIFDIRPARPEDIDFLVETIIQAEKSGTSRLGLALIFNLTEEKLRPLLAEMLEEETEGCEFSLNSFIVAEVNGKLSAAVGGWIEGYNEDKLSSAMLKSNLLNCTLPYENLMAVGDKHLLLKDLSIERSWGAYQIEYVYTAPDSRGLRLAEKLIGRHILRGLSLKKELDKVQVQVFAENEAAMKVYIRLGFIPIKEYVSSGEDILRYLPGRTKLLLEKTIKEKQDE